MNKLKSNEEKSSCKKKFIFKSISKDDLSKTLNLKVVKWSIRLSLFIIFGTLFSLSIYKVVVFQRTCCNNSTSIRTRSMYPRSHFINTPVIYEIEPITFFDSNYDGIGDLNGIIQRLDYIQNNLFVNCIIIKNIQNSFSFKYYNLQLVKMNLIDEKIGTIEDLKNLVTEAHKRSIKVNFILHISIRLKIKKKQHGVTVKVPDTIQHIPYISIKGHLYEVHKTSRLSNIIINILLNPQEMSS